MARHKTWQILLAALVCAAGCSGCASYSADGLYALPRQSDAYYELQTAIDSVMEHGSAYAGPLAGPNQQAVQLADLDGDGSDEAIAFVKTTGEKPLKVYVFDKTAEGRYENTAVVEGDGSAFDAVEYINMDTVPGAEILVGRQISDQILQSLRVYRYENGTLTELMSANYTEYSVADLDSDDCRDVFVLRTEAESGSVAELYRWKNERILREPEVSLSAGAKQVKRMVAGLVSPDVPGVFVASAYGEDSIVTDIFAFRDTRFCNVAASTQSGSSNQTVRDHYVYASDIDADGLIELPAPVALPSANAQEETQWVIDWYNLLSDGQKQVKQTTYHNYPSGWYLEIPDQWDGQLSVTRSVEANGTQTVTFSRWNGREEEPEPIVTLYALTGEGRLERASTDGRFLLAEKGEMAYAAQLGSCTWAQSLTQENLRTMFHFIQVDWNSGEL